MSQPWNVSIFLVLFKQIKKAVHDKIAGKLKRQRNCYQATIVTLFCCRYEYLNCFKLVIFAQSKSRVQYAADSLFTNSSR